MENASKALIIAGAILISILLISVGVMVMNSASDVTGQAGETMGGAAVQSFNAEFLNYEGVQKGSSIRNLYQVYIGKSSNSEAPLEWDGPYGSSLKSTKNYTVDFEYGTDGDYKGYICKIKVTEGSTGGTTGGTTSGS